MSNERERLARQWATSTLPRGDAKTLAAIEHILATTTEPTMAGVKWEHEKHHLAGATTLAGFDAVMMWCDEEDTGHIITDLGEWRPDQLTPNGKRYELREVTDKPAQADEPEYPETLTTEDDYENAPDGTIVAAPGWRTLPLLKRDGVWHRDGLIFESGELVDDRTNEVLRWGWGE